MVKEGVFICLEGLDASGKTTHSKLLVRKLRKMGLTARYTREPSNGEIGRLIRKMILKREERTKIAIEALLFAADRLDHIQREIAPSLARGEIVVSDRYLYSSLAYQGGAGLDLDWIEELNKFALKPDLALYIDVPPEVAIKRLSGEKSVMERLETQRRVREIYLQMVKDGRIVYVDGNRAIRAVSREILDIVKEFLKERGLLAKES